MSKTAVFKIDGDIGEKDPMFEAMGIPQPVVSARDVSDFIAKNQAADVFEIHIRSNGGSVEQANDMHDQLVASGKTIKCIGFKVCSAATIPFLAAEKENRMVSENATFLPHFPFVQNPVGDFRSDDLLALAQAVIDCENKVVAFYMKKIGGDEAALREMMAKDSDIGSKGAIDFGFAGGILGVNESVTEAKALAYSHAALTMMHKSNTNNNETMEVKEIKAKMGFFEKALNTLMKTAGIKMTAEGDIVASTAKLKDDTEIHFDGELAVDTPVFSDAELITPVADGDHELADGRTIVVAGGKVTEIKEVEAEADATTMAAMQETIDDQKAEIVALKKERATMLKTQATMRGEITTIMKQFGEIKAIVPDAAEKQNVKVEDMTPAQRHRASRPTVFKS